MDVFLHPPALHVCSRRRGLPTSWPSSSTAPASPLGISPLTRRSPARPWLQQLGLSMGMAQACSRFGIECTTCGNGGSDAFTNNIVFHVADATVADLTQANNVGNISVADVINLETGRTGPVDVHHGSNTPDSGSTALLLGLGLFGLGFVRDHSGKKPRAHSESVFERATVGWLFCFVHAWNPSI